MAAAASIKVGSTSLRSIARVGTRFAGPLVNSAWDIPEFYQGYSEGSYTKMLHATGSFAGGWFGGLLAGGAYGAITGVETGPGMVLTTAAGMLVGSLLGEHAMQQLGQMIDDDNLRRKKQALFDAIDHNLPATSDDPLITSLITGRDAVKKAQDDLAALKSSNAAQAKIAEAQATLEQATTDYHQKIFDLAYLGKLDPNATTGPNSLSGGDILKQLVAKGSGDDNAAVDNFLGDIYKKLPLDAAKRFPTPEQFKSDDRWGFLRTNPTMIELMGTLNLAKLTHAPLQNAAYGSLAQYASPEILDIFKTPDGLDKYNEKIKNGFLHELVRQGPTEHTLISSLSGTMPTLTQLEQIPGLKGNPVFEKLATLRDQQRAAIDAQVAEIKAQYWGPTGPLPGVGGIMSPYQDALTKLNETKRQFDEQFQTAVAKLSNADLLTLHQLGRATSDILAKLPQTANELNSKPGWEFLKTDPVIAKTVELLQAGKRDEAFTNLLGNADQSYLDAIQDPKKLVALNEQVKGAYIELLTKQLLAGNEHLDQLNLPDKYKKLVEMARKINTGNDQRADAMMHPGMFDQSAGAGNALAYFVLGHFSSNDFKTELDKYSNADLRELSEAIQNGALTTPQPQKKAELAPPPPGDRNRSRIDLAAAEPTQTQVEHDKQKPKVTPAPVMV